MESKFELKSSLDGDSLALWGIGEFDLAARQLVLDVAAPALAQGQTVVLDLKKVTFIDASALGAHSRLRKRRSLLRCTVYHPASMGRSRRRASNDRLRASRRRRSMTLPCRPRFCLATRGQTTLTLPNARSNVRSCRSCAGVGGIVRPGGWRARTCGCGRTVRVDRRRPLRRSRRRGAEDRLAWSLVFRMSAIA